MELITHIKADFALTPARKGIGSAGPQALHLEDVAAVQFGHAITQPPEGMEPVDIVTLVVQRVTDEGICSSTCAVYFASSRELALKITQRANEILSGILDAWITRNADKHPADRHPLVLDLDMRPIIAECIAAQSK